MKIDALDKKILYLLDLNSREKESEIAQQLKVGKQVVAYRLRRLIENGIIKQF